MAHIAVITNSIVSTTATRIGEALTAAGHTFTQVDDADSATTDFSGYDLILLGIYETVNAIAIADALVAFNETGKPVIIGGVGTSSGTGVLGAAYYFGLCESEFRSGGDVDAGEIVPNAAGAAHSILTGFLSGTTYDMLGHNAGDIGGGLYNHTGVTLATAGATTTNLTGEAVIVTFESGTEGWNGIKFGNRVVFLGFLYNGGSDYSANGDLVIQRSVTWALAGVATALDQIDVSVFRTYAVIDSPDYAVSTEIFRSYVVLAPPAIEISSSVFRAYVVLGEDTGPPPALFAKRRVQNINYH